jgi:hypothetical protein
MFRPYSEKTNRQHFRIVIVCVFIFIVWQLWGLHGLATIAVVVWVFIVWQLWRGLD